MSLQAISSVDTTSIWSGAPTGKALVVTSIEISAAGTLGTSVPVRIATVGATCSTNPNWVYWNFLEPGETRALATFPAGLPIGNHALCITTRRSPTDINPGIDLTLDFTVAGYYVPATQCVTPNHCY